ncbi:DUF3140 domain-containing protein [Adhaeribacter rhizoryzae]|uniref:DUF3140 domain-containing protein n=1 Tax=Adhaeribacter rhizoryzae TaxID=2607907 RepID=A0A5M6DP97_9BACT|nr:DUF3140 domain-containing protein [Adhaeribacter rhizoryzae]KAA5548276.1 DUF3140 domain-containing protein [Adhaeribacter rhizoryzae]
MLHLLKKAQTGVRTREDIYAEFSTLVNMSPLELENWLETKTSQTPAQDTCESELVIDKKFSRKLIKILLKRKFMLTKGDYEFMDKVVNHVSKLYSHKPTDDILVSTWRYALMNLGHDPVKVLEN